MRIQNPFRLGLFGGLGVLVAIGIGVAFLNLATILTYIGAALFIAMGIDPLVTWLDKRGVKRWLAILIVLFVLLGAVTGLVLAIIPVISAQVSTLIQQLPDFIDLLVDGTAREWAQDTFPFLPVDDIADEAIAWAQSGDTITNIFGGVLQTGIAVAGGVFGFVIVLILTIYFVASLHNIKRAMYQLVPASKREKFIDLSEQISVAVGRFVVGQLALAFTNGILTFIFMSILRAEYSALLAFIAFLFSLVPLVGTISGSTIIVASLALFPPDATTEWAVPAWIIAAIYYLVYMQVEAYLLSPNIMRAAVKVPGVVVVIAALAGGTLAGILGALVAIPVAASILLIFKQVVIPRQNTL
ncbi:AI-2E family transporter [Lysobacter korlensis]|uniref:AI-2E family transporter n=1 Tax=Lysobacter korlensis TaxID=553636 RepID=A0ABV6RNM1_9GAMM